MTYVAEPYFEVAEQLLTGLTGGVARETHRFYAAAGGYRFEHDDALGDTVQLIGQAGGAFFAFRPGIDFGITADGELVFAAAEDDATLPAAGATWPDEASEFHVAYYRAGGEALLTDRNVGSLTRTLGEAFARELAVLRKQLALVYDSAFIDTAEGSDLDRVVALLAITRRRSGYASGKVRFYRDTPAPGDIFIPEDTRISTALNPPAAFATTAPKVLRRGQLAVEADVRALMPGAAGLVAERTITVIDRGILGLAGVENAAPTVIGGAGETDVELRLRAKKALERAGRATPRALMHALAETAGLRDNDIRIVEELALRPGVVQVFVAREPEAQLAALVEQAVLATRAAGIRVEHNLAVALPFTPADELPVIAERDEGETTEAPPGGGFQLPLAMDLTVFPENPRIAGTERDQLETALKAALLAYVDESAIGGTLVYNRIVGQLMAVAGVLDLVLLVTPKDGVGDHGKRNLAVAGRPPRHAGRGRHHAAIRRCAGAVRLRRPRRAQAARHAGRRQGADQGAPGRVLREPPGRGGGRGADGRAGHQRPVHAGRGRSVLDRRVRRSRPRDPRRRRRGRDHAAGRHRPRLAARRAGGHQMSQAVRPFPLYVRDTARPLVLDAVEGAIGRLDGRAADMPPTAAAYSLLGRVLAAYVLRERTTSSERPRLATLQGLRLEDLSLAESLQAAWQASVITQALRDELELIDVAYAEQLRALRTAAAGSSGRGKQILSRFPAFMRSDRRGKALGAVAHALGRDLDEADRLLGTIRDAHALPAAREERDLLQLAALLGLQRADVLLLAKLHEQGFFASGAAPGADAYDQAEQAYTRYTTDLRQAITRVSRILLRGCATIPALLEGAMVLVNGDPRDPADAARDPEADARYPAQILVHPDAGLPMGGFIHGLPLRYGMLEAVGEGFERREREGFVYLVENPVVDKQTDDAPRHGRDRFRVRRGGFFHGPVAARITGQGGRTVRPRITNLATHRGFGFRGNVPDGAELVFTTEGRAFLDGAEVTADCHVFKGALFDGGRFDDASAPHVFAQSVPARALDRNRPLPALVPVEPLPTLRLLLGDSDWQFDVEEGAFDASAFDACVFALPADETVRAALPPSANVQLLWREHEPFTVRVLLPAPLQSLEPVLLGGSSLKSLVRAGLERFRAAGIRLEVDWFDDTWVLDESVLRDSAAVAGLGVSFDGTIPPCRLPDRGERMITPPPLLEAAPGNPITAEGWNNLRQAVLALYEAFNKSPGTLTAQLKSKDGGAIVADAVVTLVPSGEPAGRAPRAALYLGATVQAFQVLGLEAGSYDLVVEAAGFAPETRPVTIGADGAAQALAVELTPSAVTVVVPNLFGAAVNVAMATLASAGLQVSRVIDSYGTDLAPSGIPAEAANSPVLNQVPEPGTVVPKNTPVQLHISAKVAQQVKVPNLAGLTLTEAKQQLAAAGLVVGETKTLGS